MNINPNSELTKYPKLYKYTYWGNFSATSAETRTQDIINNRNAFADFFQLKKYDKKGKEYLDGKGSFDMWDHLEAYHTEKGTYMYITSPYGEYDDVAKELGFIRLIKPLYSKHAWSYYKEFSNKIEYNKFFRIRNKKYWTTKNSSVE